MGCDNSYWTRVYDDRIPEDPKTPPYACHITSVTVDYAQEDEWSGGIKTQGKQVDTETNILRWDTLDEAMKCAEAHTERRTASYQGGVLSDLHTTYQVDIHRIGLPLLHYSGKRWSALGDDYLDPYVDDSIQESFLHEALDIDPTLALTNF